MKDILDKVKKVIEEKILPFCKENKRYLAALGLFVCFVVVLVFFTGSEFNAERIAKINSKEVSGEDYVPDAEFKIDAYPEVNELVTKYFQAYVNADVDTLETLATPISEMEKSYITTMSAFYEEYQNVVCYTKQGLSKDSYIVSACFNIKFKGLKATAPSMVLFYVQTAEDGSLYINNLYSDFNMMYAEKPLDKDVFTALRKYTIQEDYLALYTEVEDAYNQLIRENKYIYNMTKRLIPGIRQTWEDNVYYVEQPTEDTQSSEKPQTTEKPQSTQTKPTTQATQKPSETQKPQSTQSETTTQKPSETQKPVVKKVKVVGVNGNVNIRKKADADSADIGDAYNGDVFVKLGETKDSSGAKWIKIKFDGNKVGYIKATFLKEVEE